MNNLLEFLKRYIYPNAYSLFIVIFLSFISSLSNLVTPYVMKVMIDNVFLKKNNSHLLSLSLILLAITLLGMVIGGITNYLYTKITSNIVNKIRVDLYDKIINARISSIFKMRTGDIVARISNDVTEVQSLLTDSFLTLITNGFNFIASCAILIYFSLKLFLVTHIFLPFSFIGLYFLRHKITNYSKILRIKSADIGSILFETFSGIKQIKAYKTGKIWTERFKIENEDFRKVIIRFQNYSLVVRNVPSAFIALSMVIGLLYGGNLYLTNEISFGTLIAFFAYQPRVLIPFQNLLGLFVNFKKVNASMDRISELFDITQEQNQENKIDFKTIESIVFQNVWYRHEKNTNFELKKINLKLRRGEIIGLVGKSGAGKSTIADLLLGFYEPERGEIFINGININNINIDALRKKVAIVTGESLILYGTIEENIIFGLENCSKENIIRVSKISQIHDFIDSLPNGYSTIVGERGITLSAGQRQRIGIARALLRNPEVIIFDEATNSIDLYTDLLIQKEIKKEMPNICLFIITHRLRSLIYADMIYHMDRGKIIKACKYKELLNNEEKSFNKNTIKVYS